MFTEITLKNFLSYGPEGVTIPLRPLNVLLGANGTGKTNLVEAISLLAATPRRGQLDEQIRKGDGISEWIYKGDADSSKVMTIEAVLKQLGNNNYPMLRHRIELRAIGPRFDVTGERVENAEPALGHTQTFFYFSNEAGVANVYVKEGVRGLKRETVNFDDSILAQRKDPETYPVLWALGEQYEKIRIFREWTFGPAAPCRQPSRTDAPADFLLPNGENLALVLSNLNRFPSVKRQVDRLLQDLSPGFETFNTTIVGGLAQLFLQESDDRVVSAKRLSDGTLRFMALLSILLHPEPPPVVVLEEPELGLHADILPTLAKLLVESSKRMQIVMTTHSDILVDALTEHYESVLFCDKVDGETIIRPADPEVFAVWCGKDAKEPKGLGQAWLAGAFGGKRW